MNLEEIFFFTSFLVNFHSLNTTQCNSCQLRTLFILSNIASQTSITSIGIFHDVLTQFTALAHYGTYVNMQGKQLQFIFNNHLKHCIKTSFNFNLEGSNCIYRIVKVTGSCKALTKRMTLQKVCIHFCNKTIRNFFSWTEFQAGSSLSV